MKIVGIDLAAKDKNFTGIAVINGKRETFLVKTDSEILEVIEKERPDLVAIDAPLSIRKPFRACERKIIKMGFHPMPLTIKSIELLAQRAILLASKIKKNCRVIEVFPSASKKILNLKFKGMSKHEEDALIAAETGKFYLQGKAKEVRGNGTIVLPRQCLQIRN